MLTGSEFPLEEVVVNRRKQVVFRLGICVVTAGCYAPLLGVARMLLWACTYAGLQAVEWLCFNANRPLFPALDRRGRAVALALLALNSAVFGGFSILELVELGPWGQVCAAYLLAGSILNTVLTTIGCRSAFAASLLPFLAYMILLPVRTLVQPDGPSGFVVVGATLAGALLGLSAVRLWKEWGQAKAAERDAVARDIAERRANEQRLIDLSHLDALTGLGNRTLLQSGCSTWSARPA